jgi:hypothetical protein
LGGGCEKGRGALSSLAPSAASLVVALRKRRARAYANDEGTRMSVDVRECERGKRGARACGFWCSRASDGGGGTAGERAPRRRDGPDRKRDDGETKERENKGLLLFLMLGLCVCVFIIYLRKRGLKAGKKK